MKPKRITMFLAAVLCMAVFLFPTAAFAASDNQPPTVNAWLNGDTLHIEADDDSGVESVYVDSHRFNYLVDGVIEVNARENHDNKEKISVYAVDFSGNKSGVVQISNPYYKAPAATTTPAPTTGTTPKPDPTPAPSAPAQTATPRPSASSQSSTTSTPTATSEPTSTPEPTPVIQPSSEGTEGAPASDPEPQPFTPDGTGSVVDDVLQQNGKEFFTVTTEAGNVFYLIIDRDRNESGVYLLNAVTEADLAALAEKDKSGGGTQSSIPTPAPEVKPTTTPETTPEPEQTEKPAQGGNTGAMIFIVIAVLAVGGAGYYFKVLRPKQQAAALPDDEFEDDEDMEYEDDPEDSGDDYDYRDETEEYDGAEAYEADGFEPEGSEEYPHDEE